MGWVNLFIEHHSGIGLALCTDESIEYLKEPSLWGSLRIKHQHHSESESLEYQVYYLYSYTSLYYEQS